MSQLSLNTYTMESAVDKIELVNDDLSVEEEIELLKPHVATIKQIVASAEAVAKDNLSTVMVQMKKNTIPKGYIPPRVVLIYLVRMGSFLSTPKINNGDTEDAMYEVPKGINRAELIKYCGQQRRISSKLIERKFFKSENYESDPNNIRVLQWNILSQTLAQNCDNFIKCPNDALSWCSRKFMISEELLRFNADILCLQEVDHYKFLKTLLSSQGYDGVFYEKPDSPCLYQQGNNGPDGCAIFYDTNKFACVSIHQKILEVWSLKSNQVALAVNLRDLNTSKEFCVVSTHLKARKDALMVKLRDEQACDLVNFVKEISCGRPVIICGDFNGEPNEPFYNRVCMHQSMSLQSAYAQFHHSCSDDSEKDHDIKSYESRFTTTKIRKDGEETKTIDYMFYTKNDFKIENVLRMPELNAIGENRLPSHIYPSDHISLVADFHFTN